MQEMLKDAPEWKETPPADRAHYGGRGGALPPGVTPEQYAAMQAMAAGAPSVGDHDGRLGGQAASDKARQALMKEAVSGAGEWRSPQSEASPRSTTPPSAPAHYDEVPGQVGGKETSARVEALLKQAEGGGHGGGVGPKGAASAAALEGAHPKGRGGILLTTAFAVVTGGAALVGGASPAEAAEAAVETAVPFADAGKELANGDTDAAQKSAVLESASWAGSGVAAGVAGAVGAGPAVVAGAVVVGGMVAYEAAKAAYETPERLRTGETFQKEKEAVVSRFEGGKDGHVAELVNAIHGKPTDTVRGLENPETMAAVEASLKSEKREGDLKTLDEFKDVDQQHVAAMKKFDMDISPEKRLSEERVNTMHNQLGF